MLRKSIVVTFWVLVAIVGYLWWDVRTWTAQRGHIEIIRDRTEDATEGSVERLDEETAGKVQTYANDGDVFAEDMRRVGREGNKYRRGYLAGVAAANGQDTATPAPEVNPSTGWQYAVSESGDQLEVRGPKRIEAWDEVSSGPYKRIGPDGIEIPADLAECCELLVPHVRRYMALVGVICEGNRCGPSFFLGSSKVLCPDEVGDGYLLVANNEANKFWGVEVASFWGNNHGKFKYKAMDAPIAACQQPAPRVPVLANR